MDLGEGDAWKVMAHSRGVTGELPHVGSTRSGTVRPRKVRHCVTWRGTTAMTHLAVRARARARERRCWRSLITLLLLVPTEKAMR
jgi:hypothetical protein